MYVFHIVIVLSYPNNIPLLTFSPESVPKIQIHCPLMGSAGNLSFSNPSSLNISSVGSCDSLWLTSFRTAYDMSSVPYVHHETTPTDLLPFSRPDFGQRLLPLSVLQ